LEAKVRIASTSSERTVPFEEIFVDAFTTSLKQGEAIVEIIVPAEKADTRTIYEKVVHPASGFALVGIAARIRKTEGRVSFARIGITGLGQKPFRAIHAEEMLEEGVGEPDIAVIATSVTDGIKIATDQNAPAGQKKHLAHVHAARALKLALE
jgi:carbon-monoxide dehydrogenase medium subunit